MHHTCSVAAHLTVADWVLGAEEMKGRERIWKCYEHAAKNVFYLFVHSGKNEKNHVLWSHERWGPTHWFHAFSLHCAVGKLVIHFNENALSSERWFSNLFFFRKKDFVFREIRRSEHQIFLENNHLSPLNFITGWIPTICGVVGEKKNHNCEKRFFASPTKTRECPHIVKSRLTSRAARCYNTSIDVTQSHGAEFQWKEISMVSHSMGNASRKFFFSASLRRKKLSPFKSERFFFLMKCFFFPPVIEIFLARHRAASHSPPQCSYERENLRVFRSPWRKIDKPQPGLVISAREDRRSTHPSIPSPSGPSGLLQWSLWVRIRRMTSGQDHGLVVLTGRRWYSIYRRTDDLLSRSDLKSRRERKDEKRISGWRQGPAGTLK